MVIVIKGYSALSVLLLMYSGTSSPAQKTPSQYVTLTGLNSPIKITKADDVKSQGCFVFQVMYVECVQSVECQVNEYRESCNLLADFRRTW